MLDMDGLMGCRIVHQASVWSEREIVALIRGPLYGMLVLWDDMKLWKQQLFGVNVLKHLNLKVHHASVSSSYIGHQ